MAKIRVPRVTNILLSHILCALVALQLGAIHSQRRCIPEESREPRIYSRSILNNESMMNHTSSIDNSSLPLEPLQEMVDNFTIFPSSMRRFLTGVSSIHRTEFAGKFPLGTIVTNNTRPEENQLVMVLHNSRNLPRDKTRQIEDLSEHYNLSNVLGNCQTIKTIYSSISGQNSKECTAIVADQESFDVLQWVRPRGRAEALPVRAGRYEKFAGDDTWASATPDPFYYRAMEEIDSYLSRLKKVLKKLAPIAEKVANAGNSITKGTIVVLSCNYGHSDLLVNFACAANKIGADMSKFLVVATDKETKNLAKELGLAVFYDEALFKSIPNEEAKQFGDHLFAAIVMSKVHCAHLLSTLGYNFLLQDVDIVLHRADYLEYFINKAEEEKYDILMQHDFTPRLEYLPWYVTRCSL
jgi:hypothetical protein